MSREDRGDRRGGRKGRRKVFSFFVEKIEINDYKQIANQRNYI